VKFTQNCFGNQIEKQPLSCLNQQADALLAVGSGLNPGNNGVQPLSAFQRGLLR
jgi:hypothetical protein